MSSRVCRPGGIAEHDSLQLVRGEHRPALLKVTHRLPRDPQCRRNRRQGNASPGTAHDRNLAQFTGPRRPDRPQHRMQRLRLALPGRQRRNLHRRLAVVPAPLVHVRFHLLPARRERSLEAPVIARDLEALHAPRHRRQDRIPFRDQPPRQLVTVVGPSHAGVCRSRDRSPASGASSPRSSPASPSPSRHGSAARPSRRAGPDLPARLKPRRRSPPMPSARLAVIHRLRSRHLLVAARPRIVPALLVEIRRHQGRRCQIAELRDHGPAS